MLHRHLKGEGYSPAQIDDIIGGRLENCKDTPSRFDYGLKEYRDLSPNIDSWDKVKKILGELSIEISTALEANMLEVNSHVFEHKIENEITVKGKSKSFAQRQRDDRRNEGRGGR